MTSLFILPTITVTMYAPPLRMCEQNSDRGHVHLKSRDELKRDLVREGEMYVYYVSTKPTNRTSEGFRMTHKGVFHSLYGRHYRRDMGGFPSIS